MLNVIDSSLRSEWHFFRDFIVYNKQKILILLTLTSFAASISGCSKPAIKITDYFADSSQGSRFVFAFVKTTSTDSAFLSKAGAILARNPNFYYYGKSDFMSVLLVHFYRIEDTTAVPEDMTDILHEKYPKTIGLEGRLNYVEHGFLYAKFSRLVPGLAISRSGLFKTEIFIPKEGIRAKDVFKIEHKPADTLLGTGLSKTYTKLSKKLGDF